MKDKVFEISNDFDVIIMAAAVSDFTPSTTSTIKIKKTSDNDSLVMSFKKTFDILKGLGTKYGKSKIIVGFAAETDNITRNAIKKVMQKNISFIVANLVGTDKSGFGTDESEAYIIDNNKQITELNTISKQNLAYEIACKIKEVLTN
jgi:phosphopantothenoylcysteine decarboxylase/phosphopantothenate--cysteine ligase